MKTSGIRCLIAVSVASTAFLVGLVAWHPLLSIVFLGVALLAIVFGAFSTLFALLRRKKSEALPIFGSLAAVSSFLFAGWFARDDLMRYAMVAESMRLVVRAEEFRRSDGIFPESAAAMQPFDTSEQVVAWIAGDSVRYLPLADGFFVTRGVFITGETFSSYTGRWEVSKL
ncbi:hypothetical protein [Actomonas aquatica]|uniref:DUF4131 domain-containing protein n=1 Tax=Actomonas aquatica TaxID=2866162 RepID=A0ABZ1CG24_9BACT|nr:hypothetical protein [Opitutus sp. WL0086]WRQ89235.1 hypothetical protein K1X11_007430 [Opitutus sp. WL0086]